MTKFDNAVKPVVVSVVDRGPDENPRYQKTIQVGVYDFHQNNLDALFIAANAPWRRGISYLALIGAKCASYLCLHFASNVMLKKHIIGVHKITGKCQPEVGRVRPLRIAARRQQELMAVIAFTENVEFADWVDDDDIDTRGLTIPEDENDVKMLVYSMNEHISSPWEEES
ncbi:hypothetical protein AVEN_181361-1 [Araneus ventricosus]|uniref:Uncharacterized protein n=1 Tax=Araneus ventricosus TaxID=182803 RepID=A0A4Y2HR95_ARAVE|nr:hypothetical protein AVEN_181361-1 [Araneus ventricosus]